MSAERRFDLALGLIGIGTVACGLLMLLAQGSAGAIVGGIGLVLVLPGSAVSALVFRRGELRLHELVLTALGTSLVIAALGALLLDRLPGDLGRTPWTILLLAVTIAALAGAALLRRPKPVPGAINERAPLVVRRFEDEDDEPGQRRFLPPVLNWILAVLALALVIAAVWLARDAANESPGFTELSAVPVAEAGAGKQLRIEVRNREGSSVDYRLRIVGAGEAPQESTFSLDPGAAKTISGGGVEDAGGRIDVALYRGTATEPFLHASYDPASELGQTAEGQ